MPEETQEESYRVRMAEQNQILGLLPFHSSARDGRRYLHYEITSKQALGDVYEKKALKYQDMVSLLTGIESILKEMQKYLLNPAHLIFDPQYMYFEPGRNRIWLCYLPGDPGDFPISLLAEFILKKLDHEEDQAVMLGYSFYQSAVSENFSLQQTLKALLAAVGEKNKGEEGGHAANKYAGERRSTNNYMGGDLAVEKKGGEPPAAEKQTAQFSQGCEEYEVDHRERKPKNKENKSDRLFQIIHPGVLLSFLFCLAVLEILFYLNFIHLTEAGGSFFLLISVEILINKFWKKTQEKKKDRYGSWDPEEDDGMYQTLREEMYEEPERPQEIGETCCLASPGGDRGMKLIFSGSLDVQRTYPDIMIGREPVYVGKIKGESDVILDSSAVSRMHARLEQRDERFYMRDLNSKNGTFHNGKRLEPQEQCEIAAGDRITFADIGYRAVYFTRNQ